MNADHRFNGSRLAQSGLLALCLLVFLANTAHYYERTIDDAYITFRYARNFVEGFGLRYNAGDEPVEGYTNFLWLMGSAAVIALHGDPMFWAKLAGIGFGAGCILLSWRLCAVLREREDLLNALPPLILATSAHFAHWAVQGLETLAPPTFVLGATLLTIRETRDPQRVLLSPWCILAAFMIRPDTVFAFVPITVYRMVVCGKDRESWKRFAYWATLCATGLAIYNGWRLAYFGDFLPNTWYAKSETDPMRGWAHLYQFYLNHGGATPNVADQFNYGASVSGDQAGRAGWIAITLPPLIIVLLLGTGAQRILLGGQAVMNAVYVVLVGGDWMSGFRFILPALPFVALCAASVPELLEERFTVFRRFCFVRVAAVLAASFAVTGQMRVDTAYVFHRDPMWMSREPGWLNPATATGNFQKTYSLALESITEELLFRTADDSTIFMSDIGFPGWTLPYLTIIDVDGLTNKYIAHAPSVRETPPSDDPVAYIMSEHRPDHLLAFAIHRGAEVPLQIYPSPVAEAFTRPEFAEYEEVWTGIKAGQNAWNHLYARHGTTPPSPEKRIQRLKDAVRANPRVAKLAETLYRESASSGRLRDDDMRELVADAIARYPRNHSLIVGVLFNASQREDLEMARIAFGASRRADPGFMPAWRLMITALRNAGESEAADLLAQEANNLERDQ